MQMLLHADLFVWSLERALEFYVGALGLRVIDQGVIDGELALFVSRGRYSRARIALVQVAPIGTKIELVELEGAPPDDPLLTPHQGPLTFVVQDLAAEISRLGSLGIQLDGEVLVVALPTTGTSSIAFLSDPDGHRIELLEPPRRPARPPG